MNEESIKKVKAVALFFIVLGVFFFGFNTGQTYPHSPVDSPSATETNITTTSITVPEWIDVEQINASWIKTTMASESTYIVAASNSVNKEHANWVCDGTADQADINQAIATLPETIVVWDNCDSSAGSWTGVQGDETISNDNVDFAEGTGSLKCLGGATNDSGIKRTGLASLDWSSYNLIRFYFKQDNCNIDYTCWLFFYDSGGNWERYDFNGRAAWHQHSMSIGSHPDAKSAAALDWTDIVEIRIQVDTDDDAYTFRVDNIRLANRIGGKVVLLEGDYTIDDKIVGDANTVLVGCGDNSRIFVAAGTDVGSGWDGSHIIFEDCDNAVIRDLQINLNGANLGGIADKSGVRFYRIYRGIMSNIRAYNLRLGGNVLSTICSNTVEISQCYVENYDDYGIIIGKCNNCSAYDNVVIGTSGEETWGIVITGGYDGENWAYDCSITNNRVGGVNTAILLRKSHRCSVIGNNCYFTGRGVGIAASTYALISNNIVDGNNIGWVGIQTYKRTEDGTNYTCEHVDIIGNVIQRCERVAANRARGVLVTEAKYSSVVGNNIRNIDSDNDGVGIEIITYYVVVSGNMIVGTHDGIMMGVSNCITGNQLYSITGDGICEGTMAYNRNSITGNHLWSITGTEILSTSGDDYYCVGNWLKDGVINLAGVVPH